MPDYNKGDFTQQGIDGFVEGGLHLNEKRCLTAKISTDEETAGLDSVEINIHDHLNDLDYSISGENLTVGENVVGIIPTGNIEITENTAEGEPLDISQYATATVNVAGGGDNVKTLELTINATGIEQTGPIRVPNIDDNGFFSNGVTANIDNPVTIQALIQEDEEEYGVTLESLQQLHFTANNTGTNCEIIYDSDNPLGLYILITDITLPASAVINVTTGGVG